jgi:hypothetical protein
MKGIAAGLRVLGLLGAGVSKAANNSYIDSPYKDE